MHCLDLQVVISAHNAEPWIERCLASVELAMARHPWILIVVDDGSADDTLKLIVNHPSQADRVIVRSYPKAANVSIAKNRAFALTLRHADRYPAILPMDADDEMTPERVTHLLPFAVFGGHRCVFGDYRYVCPDNPERHDTVIQASPELVPELVVEPISETGALPICVPKRELGSEENPFFEANSRGIVDITCNVYILSACRTRSKFNRILTFPRL